MNSMKRPGHFFRVSIFFSLFLLTVMSATLIEANSDTSINGVTVPDKNLRRYILSYDENQDGSLSDAELKKAKSILISKPIRDFTGISLLKYMECFSYPYKDLIIDYPLRSEKLDLSDMRYLKSLHVGNYVEEIICNNCSKLERICAALHPRSFNPQMITVSPGSSRFRSPRNARSSPEAGEPFAIG